MHDCAVQLGIGEHLRLGRGEERNGGRQRKTLLANALEAVIAAVYLDGGIDAARRFITEHVLALLERGGEVELIGRLNHKSVLQERTQALGLPVPRYSTVEAAGPEHAKIFTVEAKIGDQLVSRASASSKKAASQRAAQLLLQKLEFMSEEELQAR